MATRRYTFTPRLPDRQWGFLNAELDLIYSLLASGAPTTITQANAFSTGEVIGISGGSWVLAQAGSVSALGVVYDATATTFDVIFAGPLPWAAHGLTVGTPYFLSSSTPGGVTATPPALGTETQQVLIPITGDDVLVRIMEHLV